MPNLIYPHRSKHYLLDDFDYMDEWSGSVVPAWRTTPPANWSVSADVAGSQFRHYTDHVLEGTSALAMRTTSTVGANHWTTISRVFDLTNFRYVKFWFLNFSLNFDYTRMGLYDPNQNLKFADFSNENFGLDSDTRQYQKRDATGMQSSWYMMAADLNEFVSNGGSKANVRIDISIKGPENTQVVIDQLVARY